MTKAQARQASPNLTRYVPGREGPGYTDHLEKLSELLLTKDLRMFGYRTCGMIEGEWIINGWPGRMGMW